MDWIGLDWWIRASEATGPLKDPESRGEGTMRGDGHSESDGEDEQEVSERLCR